MCSRFIAPQLQLELHIRAMRGQVHDRTVDQILSLPAPTQAYSEALAAWMQPISYRYLSAVESQHLFTEHAPMYRYRINKIRLNDGTELAAGNLVVLVGPNNAGKSRALRDIVSLCAPVQNIAPRPLVVQAAEWNMPTSVNELDEREKKNIREEPNGTRLLRSLDPSLTGERNYQVSGWTDANFINVLANRLLFATLFGSQFVGHVATQNRLQLVQQTASPQFRRHSMHLLHALYWKGKDAVELIRKTIKNQFDLDLALDFSTLAQIVFRVGRDMETIPEDPRDASLILEKYERLDDQGDGLRSFVGIMTALLCADRDVLLIDEPEAFLHPPQAFRIGELLAESATSDRQIIVATHSSDVLQGMLGKASDAMIVRLERVGDKNQVRMLDQKELQAITVDPLLQSARVLDGIFYPAAMVVEADADARFYHATSHKSAPKLDVHTVNAQNKQTVARVTSLYRKLGIRCTGVVDFDVLNDGTEFAKQLDALGMTGVQREETLASRNAIGDFVEKQPILERTEAAVSKCRTLVAEIDSEVTEQFRQDSARVANLLRRIVGSCSAISDTSKPWNRFKEHGKDLLTPELKTKFEELSARCASMGLSINPYGELESLLVDQGIKYTTNKGEWIQLALALLPNLSVDSSKKVWAFTAAIQTRLRAEI